jgi:rubrerythrin
MKFNELKEIIDFAIEKEQEAADFYNYLKGKITQKSIAREVGKMAVVEEGHRDRLKNLDISDYTETKVTSVQDLKIADYLVDKEPTTSDMTWQDLIQIAMRRELASMRLYEDLAKLTPDPKSKQLFGNLADEEREHKLFFEKIWDEEILTDN